MPNDPYWNANDLVGCKPVFLDDSPNLPPLPPLIDFGKKTTDEVRLTSPTGGQKGSKLARFDLIPPSVLWELAEHYGKGAEKYDDNNWMKGYDWKLSFASAIRHLMSFWKGEDYDTDVPIAPTKHVVAAAWHCIALAWFMDNMPQYDTRAFDPRVKAPREDAISANG